MSQFCYFGSFVKSGCGLFLSFIVFTVFAFLYFSSHSHRLLPRCSLRIHVTVRRLTRHVTVGMCGLLNTTFLSIEMLIHTQHINIIQTVDVLVKVGQTFLWIYKTRVYSLILNMYIFHPESTVSILLIYKTIPRILTWLISQLNYPLFQTVLH